MIVYGDHPRREDPRARLAALEAALRTIGPMPPGLERHAALVGTLIEAGELAQGLADAAMAERQLDAPSPAAEAAMSLAAALARQAWASWQSGFRHAEEPPWAALATLQAATLPSGMESKQAEGFAHYALYPEAYGLAALALPATPALRVIGLRSIGTTLSAMVAAARDAPVPITLRPVGHPFHRELAVAPALAATLLAAPAADFAIVDEGPGLSGSSFGAVMDFLLAKGVAPHRLHLLPGHAGEPGPEAAPLIRARWQQAARYPASFETLLLDAPRPEHRLAHWAATRLGPAAAPMQDLGGGAWRAERFPEAAWPPIHPYMERRKYLFSTGDGRWLLKFAGLGRHGQAVLDRACQLHGAGFTPEVLGLLHGFLVERWLDKTRPLEPTGADRAALRAHLPRYLAYRAREMPAPAEAGASCDRLWAMAVANTREALGEPLAARLARWQPHLPALERQVRRVWTDNRMQAWEWLVLPDGRLMKTDALEHAAAHDLVGCQDITWDVAGAVAELGLSRGEGLGLLARLGRDAALLDFLLPCYLAFQLGYYSMAVDAAAWNPAEAARARAAVSRYAGMLQQRLAD